MVTDNMPFPKDVLNELRWSPDKDLELAEIVYEHRGAPSDEKTISGDDITELGTSFFKTAESMIPYHRILQIIYEGETIFNLENYG